MKKKVKKPCPSAMGERRAISGFNGQYRVAAHLIIGTLRQDSLVAIRVADPEAGRVDDIQIVTPEAATGHQVKWSQFAGTITFNDLIKPSKDKPALIDQLADGWKRLRQVHPTKATRVRLITNDRPSTSKKSVPVGLPAPQQPHFAAFLAQGWAVAKAAGDVTAAPTEWQPALEGLRTASKLTAAEFNAFIGDVSLDVGYQLPTTASSVDEVQHLADIERLAAELPKIAGSPERLVEVTVAQLLDRLDWRGRAEYRSVHAFPLDDKYHEAAGTAKRLRIALNQTEGGYIAVIGSPGSGKSSLLTDALSNRSDRLVRYYGYVPEARKPGSLRGEAASFLHDVSLRIDRFGFRVGRALPSFEERHLQERLTAQLQLLHEDWKKTGIKTLILVDGLDHIGRELKPQKSLLCSLPSPAGVPEGVVFVLGSQTDQLPDLPTDVQLEIQKKGRRIEMAPLSKPETMGVIKIADKVGVLKPRHRARIYELSDGHPLALRTLLNQALAPGVQDLDALLKDAPKHSGQIDDSYEKYWREIQSEDETVALLGLIARLRIPFQWHEVEAWEQSAAVVLRIKRLFLHYFKPTSGGRWTFFHNSFRLFLERKTGESSPGQPDQSLEAALHKRLADHCGKSKDNRLKVEQLYHLLAAGDHDDALTLATPVYFRNQFDSYRPLDAIQDDINLALVAAATRKDFLAIIRLIASGSEMQTRGFEFSDGQGDVAELLIGLGEAATAAEYLHDGARLRIKSLQALRMCPVLIARGANDLAEKVFRLAEPDYDDMERNFGHEREELIAWSRAAASFYSPKQFHAALNKHLSRLEIQPHPVTNAVSHGEMLAEYGMAEVHRGDRDAVDELLGTSPTKSSDDYKLVVAIAAAEESLDTGNVGRAKKMEKYIATAISDRDIQNVSFGTKLAQIYYRLGDRSRASALLKGLRIEVPEKMKAWPGDHFGAKLRFFRLKCLMEPGTSAKAAVPDSSDSKEEGWTYFQRAVFVIAKMWAPGWLKGPSGGDASEAFSVLRLYHNHDFQETRDWIGWREAQGNRDELFISLLQAVASQGPGALDSLKSQLEREWSNSDSDRYWPSTTKQAVIVEISRHDMNWARDSFRKFCSGTPKDEPVSEQITESIRHARTALILGEPDIARTALSESLAKSFGVGYRKDYQLNHVFEWLPPILARHPDRSWKVLKWLARAVVSVEYVTEGRAARLAANELLVSTFKWSPSHAIQMFKYFARHGIVWYEEAIQKIVEAALERADCPLDLIETMLSSALVPLSTSGDSSLTQSFIETVRVKRGPVEAEEAAKRLIRSLDIDGFARARPAWKHGIALALKNATTLGRVGLSPDSLQDPRSRSDGSNLSTLKLPDGTVLSELDVLARCSTVKQLQKLLDEARPESYFDVRAVAAPLIATSTPEDRILLAPIVERYSHPTDLLVAMSEKARSESRIAEARGWGERALLAGSRSGWISHYDGGSRLKAIDALAAIDANEARDRAFKAFADDIKTGETMGPYHLLQNLKDMSSRFDLNIDAEGAWAEMEGYLRAMFKHASLPDDEPSEPTADADSSESALLDLAIEALTSPARLASSSMEAACLRLAADPSCLEATVQQKWTSRGVWPRALMPLVESMLRSGRCSADFVDAIEKATPLEDIEIQRCVARALGKPFPKDPPKPNTQLAATYKLTMLPPSPELPKPKFKVGQPLPDSKNPIEIVKPFDIILRATSRMSGVPLQNLAQRAVDLMRGWLPEAEWNEEGERKVRAYLEGIALRVAFVRPRSALAQRATSALLGELHDAAKLSRQDLLSLMDLTTYYDPDLNGIEASTRPAEISKLPFSDDMFAKHDEWIDALKAEDLGRLRYHPADGRIVLGEATELKNLDWATPSEARRFATLHPHQARPRDDQAEQDIFHRVANELSADYVELGEENTIIIRNDQWLLTDGPYGWIALNPTIAKTLGWTPAPDRLFAWLDADGNLAVETVHWRDGWMQHGGRHIRSEVAEGWLVLATPKAHAEIERLVGSLTAWGVITRSAIENHDERSKTVHGPLGPQ
ncbi:MAG: hypothetical protein WCU88_08085 [Elusimicrobiota bacterium]|jgi:hypothetical protein